MKRILLSLALFALSSTPALCQENEAADTDQTPEEFCQGEPLCEGVLVTGDGIEVKRISGAPKPSVFVRRIEGFGEKRVEEGPAMKDDQGKEENTP